MGCTLVLTGASTARARGCIDEIGSTPGALIAAVQPDGTLQPAPRLSEILRRHGFGAELRYGESGRVWQVLGLLGRLEAQDGELLLRPRHVTEFALAMTSNDEDQEAVEAALRWEMGGAGVTNLSRIDDTIAVLVRERPRGYPKHIDRLRQVRDFLMALGLLEREADPVRR
jgi:hypothetical protein